jgi:hypothetical protein
MRPRNSSVVERLAVNQAVPGSIPGFRMFSFWMHENKTVQCFIFQGGVITMEGSK